MFYYLNNQKQHVFFVTAAPQPGFSPGAVKSSSGLSCLCGTDYFSLERGAGVESAELRKSLHVWLVLLLSNQQVSCALLEIAAMGCAGAGGHYYPDNKASQQTHTNTHTEIVCWCYFLNSRGNKLVTCFSGCS